MLNETGNCETPRTQADYQSYLKSDHWIELRQLALAAANRNCEICHGEKHLHCHHLRYRQLHDCTKDDIMVLCDLCHHHWHSFNPPSIQASRDFVFGFVSAVRLIHETQDIKPIRNLASPQERRAQKKLERLRRKESVINDPVVSKMAKSDVSEYKFKLWARGYFEGQPHSGSRCTIANNLYRKHRLT